MSGGGASTLFDDTFSIDDIDSEGKKFERGTSLPSSLRFPLVLTSPRSSVSRLMGKSALHGMSIALDYNAELYPLSKGQDIKLVLASSLRLGAEDIDADGNDAQDVWRPDGKGKEGLEKDFDYVMYGKVCSLLSLFANVY